MPEPSSDLRPASAALDPAIARLVEALAVAHARRDHRAAMLAEGRNFDGTPMPVAGGSNTNLVQRITGHNRLRETG